VPSQEYTPPLIYTKRGAIISLCLTAFVFGLSVRALFAYVRHGGRPQFQWPFTLALLPHWANVTINIAFYAYLLWLGIAFLRIARGAERIVVAGWLTDVLLGPLKLIFPPIGLAALRYFQTIAMAAAFFAAVSLVRKPYRKPERNETKALKQRLIVLGIAIGVMLLAGAVLYFVP